MPTNGLKDRMYARCLLLVMRESMTMREIRAATGISRGVLYRLLNLEPCRWTLPMQRALERPIPPARLPQLETTRPPSYWDTLMEK